VDETTKHLQAIREAAKSMAENSTIMIASLRLLREVSPYRKKHLSVSPDVLSRIVMLGAARFGGTD